MILKKPYAFLIKKFRLIHIIITILTGFILIKSYNLYSFFSRYVSSVYTTLNDATPSNYITIFMFLISILIVVLSSSIYFLMKKKKKPHLLYIVLSTYYLVYLAIIIYYFALLKGMESVALSIRDAMIYRDLALIVFLPQVVFLILSLIRGVGFDIKKFNFSKDLKDLDINEEDNEEFEFVFGLEDYKYKRTFRRKIREFKYYVLENKFVFTILTGLTILVLTIILVINFTVYNRTYGRKQKINANNLTMQVNNAFLTNVDYTGQVIEKGKYFLVLNITFTNTSGYSTVLNLSSYQLRISNDIIYPTLSRNNYFVDLGAGYQKEKIENGSTASYILVYELNEKQKAKKYTLRVVDEIIYKTGSINSKYKNISLRPNIYDSIETVGTSPLKTKVNLYESILDNSSIIIDSYELYSKFTYSYEACIRSYCSNKTDVVVPSATKNKTLLVLTGNLNLDNNSSFVTNAKNTLSFFDAFVQIKYDDKFSLVSNKTPSSILGKYVLEVDNGVKNAKKLDLYITTRDKRYIINLKP